MIQKQQNDAKVFFHAFCGHFFDEHGEVMEFIE
jgi:hypothetical protein